MTDNLKTGIAALDQYLAKGYDEVQGFSSRFSATICGHLLRRQRELGVRGSVAEVGTFEGRFSIAMGLALGEGEYAYFRTQPAEHLCASFILTAIIRQKR